VDFTREGTKQVSLWVKRKKTPPIAATPMRKKNGEKGGVGEKEPKNKYTVWWKIGKGGHGWERGLLKGNTQGEKGDHPPNKKSKNEKTLPRNTKGGGGGENFFKNDGGREERERKRTPPQNW